MRYFNSKKGIIVFCAAIYLLLLTCSFLTPKVADDWEYSLSFATGEPLSSLADIVPSMRAHAVTMNGRLFSHALVQTFLFLPRMIFPFLNAGMFLALILLLYRLCRGTRSDSLLLLAVIFGAVWVFTPDFGQVFLWLDGACNYGWSCTLGLLFLLPYFDKAFVKGNKAIGPPFWVFWMLPGVLIGGYLENTSVAVLFLSAVLWILARFYRRERLGLFSVLPLLAAGGGFLFMVTRPAEAVKAFSGGWFSSLGSGVVGALLAYRELAVPVCFFAVAFVLCLEMGCERDRLILAAVLFFGSLFAAFSLAAASYCPLRCMAFPAVLLIGADGVLFSELLAGRRRTLALCAAAVLAVAALYNGLFGMADIVNTYRCVRGNEAQILAGRERGQTEFNVPMVKVYTKYSPLCGQLKYLDTEDPGSWPNHFMADELGVSAILGFEEE